MDPLVLHLEAGSLIVLDKPIDSRAEPTMWLYLLGWNTILPDGVYDPIDRICGYRIEGEEGTLFNIIPSDPLGELVPPILQLWALQA